MNRKQLVIVAIVVAAVVAFFVFDLGRYLSLDYFQTSCLRFTVLSPKRSLALRCARARRARSRPVSVRPDASYDARCPGRFPGDS